MPNWFLHFRDLLLDNLRFFPYYASVQGILTHKSKSITHMLDNVAHPFHFPFQPSFTFPFHANVCSFTRSHSLVTMRMCVGVKHSKCYCQLLCGSNCCFTSVIILSRCLKHARLSFTLGIWCSKLVCVCGLYIRYFLHLKLIFWVFKPSIQFVNIQNYFWHFRFSELNV